MRFDVWYKPVPAREEFGRKLEKAIGDTGAKILVCLPASHTSGMCAMCMCENAGAFYSVRGG